MKENSAAQAATQHPIDEAIVILTEEAAALRECHTPSGDRDDWTGESEAKAAHDNMMRVAAALSKLRAPVADERGKPKMPAPMRAGDCYPDFMVQPVGTAEIYAEVIESWARQDERARASAPVADSTPAGMKEICPACGHQFGCFHSPYIDKLRATAPVAGEAKRQGKFLPEHVTQQMIWNVQSVIEAECGGLALDERQARNVMSFLMSEHGPNAAPQASALDAEYSRGRADGFDAGHGAALEKAAAALEDHRKAGREWVPGSLWDTLSREAAARIRALKQPQAITDLVTHGISVERIAPADIMEDRQQRAGSTYAEGYYTGHRDALAIESAKRNAGYAGVTVWVGDKQVTQVVTKQALESAISDELLERFKVARAALSAPQAEQGERDAK